VSGGEDENAERSDADHRGTDTLEHSPAVIGRGVRGGGAVENDRRGRGIGVVAGGSGVQDRGGCCRDADENGQEHGVQESGKGAWQQMHLCLTLSFSLDPVSVIVNQILYPRRDLIAAVNGLS
jgi:hypothetical protein